MWKKYVHTLIGGIVLGVFCLNACQPAEEEPAERPREEGLITPPAIDCMSHDEGKVCEAISLENEVGETLSIKVTIPGETDHNWDVVIQTEPMDLTLQEMMAEAEPPFGEEASLMLVTNLKIIEDPEGKTENPPTPFNPPIKLEVEYTARQWEDAIKKGFDSPKLVFFNQEMKQWEEFENIEVLPGKDGDEQTGGTFRIIIENWFDPPIGLVS